MCTKNIDITKNLHFFPDRKEMPVNVITDTGFSTISSPKIVININSFKILKYPLHDGHA